MTLNIGSLYNSFSGHAFKSKDFFDNGIPLIRIGDINNSKVEFSNSTVYLPSHFQEKYEKFLVKKGDVLIGLSGASLGKFGIYDKKEVALINQRILVLRETSDLRSSTDYLSYYLNILQEAIKYRAVGGAQPNISPSKILKFEIKHPLEDQLKIVAHLNKIQDLIEKRTQTIQLFDGYIRSVFLEMFGDPYLNEIGYPRKKLKEIVKKDKIITYGIVQAGPHVDNGIPYIKSGNIKNGAITIEKLNKTSSEIALKYERSRCFTGDLIMSIRATVGAVAILPEELNGANLTQGTARLSLNNDTVGNIFMYSLLSTRGAKAIINKYVKGSTFKEISLTKLRELEFPIPSRSDQAIFERLYLKFADLKSKYIIQVEKLNILFQSSLQNAFSEDAQIDENEIFDSLIQNLSTRELKEGNRLEHLVNWINKENCKFKTFEQYDEAWNKLRELVNDGSIEQYLDDDTIKLKLAK
ncbi:restriction endonuclease subunit S [Ancylomarina sp. DW003]|nr:restriction endonuclease subunit S [Ancylomarina sp. DW003]MDE5423673.1 restriction endonuclease subunit S [Ancylomarina sp. DW003]